MSDLEKVNKELREIGIRAGMYDENDVEYAASSKPQVPGSVPTPEEEIKPAIAPVEENRDASETKVPDSCQTLDSPVESAVSDSVAEPEKVKEDPVVPPPPLPESAPETDQGVSVCFSGVVPSDESSGQESSTVRTASIYTDSVPGIILAYKTRRTEPTSVRTVVVEPLIKEQILLSPLPFGTVGTPYRCTLELSSKDLTDNFFEIGIIRCLISRALDELGLSCQYREGESLVHFTGNPKKDFSGEISFGLVRHDVYEDAKKNADGGKVSVKYACSKPFTINEDPRNLWQDLPFVDEDGYPYENNDNTGVDIALMPGKKDGIEIIAASRRGRSHAHVGKPRDDAFYYETDEASGWNFVAVADGAGSAKYSRKGAQIACKTSVKQLRELIGKHVDSSMGFHLAKAKEVFTKSNGNLDDVARQEFGEKTKLEQIFHTSIDSTIRALHEETKKREAVIKDYHTTLICAAFKYFGDPKVEKGMNGWFIASYWVGDGGAAILRWNGTADTLVLGEPDGGEFAGQTRFLTIPDEIHAETIKKRVRFSFCDTFEALLLATDGITDPFFPSEAAVADGHRWLEFYTKKLKEGCDEEPNGCPSIFDPQQTPQKKSEDLLQWLNFWSKGNHDDRTLLIVKPK